MKAIEEVWKKNSYQRKEFRVIPGERWLDLGSNIGAFSVFAGLRGCSVRSYEANADCAAMTSQNLSANGILPQVTLAAIVPDSVTADHVTFFQNHRPMAQRRHSLFEPKKDFITVRVPALRFKDLPLHGTDAIKMNIEGTEIQLLEEATDFGSVKKLVLEYSWDKDPSIDRYKALVTRLRQWFPYVDQNKRLPEGPKWVHYPPNIFMYLRR